MANYARERAAGHGKPLHPPPANENKATSYKWGDVVFNEDGCLHYVVHEDDGQVWIRLPGGGPSKVLFVSQITRR